jgi:diguanylate cyclase (GGDEF)-like protein
VLAVDDDPTYRRLAAHLLAEAGFRVSLAASGEEALEILDADQTVSLLVVDLAMPGIDGIETVKRARQEITGNGIYSILVTANETMELRLRALDSGLDDFVAKSAPAAEMVARVRSAARRVQMERTLRVRNEQLETLALTDELTKVANRRGLLRATEAMREARSRFAAILLDLDRFKMVNDQWGHTAGDAILNGVAATLRRNTRSSDIIARYGGDEFVVLLPATTVKLAEAVARRLAGAIATLRWNFQGEEVAISVTFGVASATRGKFDIDTMVATCDRTLFHRKARRRAPLQVRP